MVAALATIIDGALVLLLTSVGFIAASVIRGRGTQITRSWLSITALRRGPYWPCRRTADTGSLKDLIRERTIGRNLYADLRPSSPVSKPLVGVNSRPYAMPLLST